MHTSTLLTLYVRMYVYDKFLSGYKTCAKHGIFYAIKVLANCMCITLCHLLLLVASVSHMSPSLSTAHM